ncbi:hypothetical protein BDW59DRAFT_66854 [Aspergillus cavernicola]|uniref:J domain-containing protein n=1 Tax=Aspergillus cavernicola TaxID=176166 RepID=A0ABR4IEA3_9EURO
MTPLPDFDPYETLGVARDATLTEIKSSHRKLVLKCHPDKIKDESLRSQAQDQFQKVQQAYELLSDETSRTKHDTKVKLAELKREMMARGASFSRASPREFRDGHYYEERVPADARSSADAFFEDENHRFTESPRPMSRKHEDYGTRPRSRATDEKRKSKGVPASATRTTAKEARESTKATRADRDKYRTKERRQQASDKQSYPDSDAYSDSTDYPETFFVPVTRPSGEHRRHRDHNSKPTESSRRSEARRRAEDDDDYSDGKGFKHDMLHSTARDYIRRSKETINNESDRRHRSSRSPPRYDSGEPEVSSKHSSHPKRSSRESRPSTSRHGSYEHLPRVHEKVPPMPTASTFPGLKGSSSPRPSHQPSKSSSNARSPSRSSRENARRSEAFNIRGIGIANQDSPSRTTKLRSEKSDLGYGSSSPTSEALPSGDRYKTTGRTEPAIVEPGQHPSHARTSYSPPPRQERRKPVRSNTYAYSPAQETSRRQLYREVDMDAHQKEKELKHARPVRPDVTYIPPGYPHSPAHYEDYIRPVGRRLPTYA